MGLHILTRLVAIIALLALPACGRAGPIEVNPGNLAAKLADAKPGDTLRLAPGNYREIEIVGRSFSPALVIDATAARLNSIRLARTNGVTIKGGVFTIGPPRKHPKSGEPTYGSAVMLNNVQDIKVIGGRFLGTASPSAKTRTEFGEGYGVRVQRGRNVEVSGGSFEGLKIGVAMTQIEGFTLRNNVFSGMREDGMAVSLARNGVIEKNECKGTRVRADEHPDCIQMWSRPTAPPTSDVIIRGNRIEGPTQGIGLHNHVRGGVDDGGFDRITIEDNDIRVSRINAINLQNGRESTIRNNRITTIPGSAYPARIRFSGDTVKVCGNSVAAESEDGQSTKDSAC